jgi:hypothetical protein
MNPNVWILAFQLADVSGAVTIPALTEEVCKRAASDLVHAVCINLHTGKVMKSRCKSVPPPDGRTLIYSCDRVFE